MPSRRLVVSACAVGAGAGLAVAARRHRGVPPTSPGRGAAAPSRVEAVPATPSPRPSRRPRPDTSALLRVPGGETRAIRASDDAKLAVTVAGDSDAPSIVLVHGWTHARAAWGPVAGLLVDAGHRVVLYDQRGHGESTIGQDGVTIRRLGLDLRDVLRATETRDAVLAGHSMGGMTVMSLAAHQPDEVAERARALVLVATAAHGLGRGRRLDTASGRILGSQLLTMAMAGAAGPRLTRGAVGRPEPTHLAALADLFAATPAATRRHCFHAMADMDLRPQLGTCHTPVTVVTGGRDQLTRHALGEAIASTIPGAQHISFPAAGHMIQWEEPEALARIIATAARGGSGA